MGALVAYLGNRVMNTELWSHVKKHCREMDVLVKRLDSHAADLKEMGKDVAVLFDREGRR